MAKYHRLAPKERYQIEALLNSGQNIRQIARQLQRSPSTISREIRSTSPAYRAFFAEQWAQDLRRKHHPKRQKIQGGLKRFVDQKIRLDWSPDQIAGRLRFRQKNQRVSHQTIYRYLQRDRVRDGDLWKHLRILRKQRKLNTPPWRPNRFEGRILIEDRPCVVEDRQRLGDYERDTVEGKRGGSLLLTLIDRTSRYAKIGWMRKKCSYLTHLITVHCLKDEPVKTITNDNGTEFTMHRATAETLDVDIYFSHPHCSWERGTNENFNGLLRQYFPRKKDIGQVSTAMIQRIEKLLNNRPRKCLGYQTPLEVHRRLKRQVLRWVC